jgi:hypothetical protein
MKKFSIILIMALIASASAFARQRSNTEALSIANKFISSLQSFKNTTSKVRAAYGYNNNGITKIESNAYANLYIYNIGTRNGFVIVSGDDCATDVLGYSDSGEISSTDIPENMKYWLDEYQREIEFAKQNGVSSSSSRNITKATSNLPASNAPLLGNIAWNQTTPYNNLCPIDYKGQRSVTGCVATAMAQVMKYWQWPVEGKGSISYYCSSTNGNINVNFEGEKYDWSNMLDTYKSGNYNDVQAEAVAKLLYHCGAASQMDFSSYASGATTPNMAHALITNFSYDANMQAHDRKYYTYEEWTNLLKTEIAAGRPVLYQGNTVEVGHEYVCDGYDENGLFHINWGWNGMSNGYFVISALNPDALGTGGGTVTGFQYNQNIVTGIAPAGRQQIAKTYEMICSDAIYANSKGTTVDTPVEIWLNGITNEGLNDYEGSVGVGLFNSDKQLVETMAVNSNDYIVAGTTEEMSKLSVTFKSSLGDGTYYIYPVYKGTDEQNYSIMRGVIGLSYYMKVDIKDGNVSFSRDENARYKLALKDLSIVGGKIYSNSQSVVTLTIENQGQEYMANFIVRVKSKTTSNTYNIAFGLEDIPSGETKTFSIGGFNKAPEGDYTMTVLYDPLNEYTANPTSVTNFVTFGDPIDVSVLKAEAPVLALAENMSFPTTVITDKTQVITNPVHIQNTGGPFSNYLVMMVYDDKGNIVSNFGRHAKFICAENTDSTVFNGNLETLPDGNYHGSIFAKKDSKFMILPCATENVKNYVDFTLTSSSGIDGNSVKRILIYPTRTDRYIHISAESPVSNIAIWNIAGKKMQTVQTSANQNEQTVDISNLTNGLYILKCYVNGKAVTCKFIKE